jgi:hypothetical protein
VEVRRAWEEGEARRAQEEGAGEEADTLEGTMRTGIPREGDNTEARREDTSRVKGIAGAEAKVSMVTRIRGTRRGGEEEGIEETVARMTTRVKAGV